MATEKTRNARRTPARVSISLLVGLAMAVSMLAQGPATAAGSAVPDPWKALTFPCPSGIHLGKVHALTATWWALCSSGLPVRSTDYGQSWSPVGPAPSGWFSTWDGGVGPDGAFYAPASKQSVAAEPGMLRFDPISGQSSAITLPLWSERSVMSGGLSLTTDATGQMWGAWCTGDSSDSFVYHLARISIDGAVTGHVQAPNLPGVYQGCPRPDIGTNGAVFLDSSPETIHVPIDGALMKQPRPPVYDAGGLTVSVDLYRVDRVTHFFGERTADPIRGHPDLIAVRDGGSPSIVLAQWRAGFLAQALPPVPDTDVVVASTKGLLAVGDRLLATYEGPLPPTWGGGDALPADSQAMLETANRYRAEAGLPPLRGDARISQAARNHSLYWTLNNANGVGLNVHFETPGRPGFTGVNWSDRCAAVGATCTDEVIYEGTGPVDAVEGWTATPFHRSLFMAPGPSAVGGAVAQGGPAVMNGDYPGLYLGRPVGYPMGLYSGPLSFPDEQPDPGKECSQGTIHEPYGTAVSVRMPGDEGASGFPDAVTVRKVGGAGGTLKGCQVGGWGFVPDEALEPGSTYEATATWSENSWPQQTWRFVTAGTPQPSDKAHPRNRIRVRAKALHSKHRLRINVSPDSARRNYTIRLGKRSTRGWKQVRKVRTHGPKDLASTRVRPGTYRLRAPAQHGLRASKNIKVRVR